MYVLFYDYVEDILERRAPHREAHLARIRANDEITMAGALGDPPTGALIVFDVGDPAVVEDFAANDPYVLAGLVTQRRVVPWKLV
ncbi:MAG TPA: YciI family protein [Thermoleophilaceae bacterium]|jgi:hypothetical protein|nr:YciI family protein [Thermoleophilaceae bacterium]